MKARLLVGAAAIGLAACATGARAQNVGGPVQIGDGVTLDPIVDANLRYEHVEQANIANDAER